MILLVSWKTSASNRAIRVNQNLSLADTNGSAAIQPVVT
jgi:hypothetical protein